MIYTGAGSLPVGTNLYACFLKQSCSINSLYLIRIVRICVHNMFISIIKHFADLTNTDLES